MKKTLISIVLCAAMVLSLGGAVLADGAPSGYTITEAGTIPDNGLDFEIRSEALVTRGVDEAGEYYTYRIYDYLGNPILDQDLYDISSVTEGVFSVRSTDTENVNCRGVVTMDGEVLIPCEAAIIKAISNETDMPDRYLEVIYGTEEVENKEDAFFYMTDSWFSLQPEEGDVLYAGYAKVYDLVNRQFVGDLIVDNPNSYALHGVGDVFTYEGRDGVERVYGADGQEIMEISGFVRGYGGNLLVVRDSGKTCMYDARSGEVLLESDLDLQYEDGYLTSYADGMYSLMDLEANPVTDTQFSIIYGISGDIVRCEIQEDVSALYDLGADALLCDMSELEKTDSYYYPIQYGYYYYSGDEGDILISPSGQQLPYDGGAPYSLAVYREGADGNRTYYVAAEDDFTLATGSSVGVQAEGLIFSRSEEGLLGAYDLFSGEELLPPQYKSLDYGGGYIFADDGSSVTVYRISLSGE